MSKPVHVDVAGRRLRLSNLDKVLYPSAGFTKGAVIDYYRRVGPTILPHLAGRPLTLKRYPEGVHHDFFYEKQCPSHRPDWLTTTSIPSSSPRRSHVDYCIVDSQAALVWVANLASLEMHVLLARGDEPDQPTMIVFDLDPGQPATLVDCARVALRLRQRFNELKLKTFVKTSGGKGLHLYVPLNRPASYDQTKPFARSIAEQFAREDSQRVTANMRKDLRAGKVFIDWSQNDEHKTTVCVYSLRARDKPTVSTPLEWDEVEQAADSGDAAGLYFEAADAIERIERVGDLFAPVLKLKQSLPKEAMAAR